MGDHRRTGLKAEGRVRDYHKKQIKKSMKEQVPVNEVEGNSLVGSFDGIRKSDDPF